MDAPLPFLTVPPLKRPMDLTLASLMVPSVSIRPTVLPLAFLTVRRQADASFILGIGIERAIEHLHRAGPPFRWWTDSDEKDFYSESPLQPWLSFEECESWWPGCRQRFESLLQEAEREQDAVLLFRVLPDDQGEIGPPYSEEWGRPSEERFS